ncbi:MAG: RagB/SusD family nutrient uptake outer membrane protein [Prevotellaceae bacterium]|nr:RagB/SusD family nutrient uptake outer membrane protein [Prevotellaceae bacterium]
MKTNIVKFVFTLMIFSTAQSCSDFLDVEPESVFTEIIVGGSESEGPKYKTKQEIEMLVSGIYTGLKSTASEIYNLDLYMLTDVRSDNAYSGSIEGWALSLDNFNVAPNNTLTAREWGIYYAMIGRANTIIENVDLVPDPALTAELKKQYRAEASILRGMMYFDLVRYYGDVPLVLNDIPDITSENIEEIYPLLYPKRASTNEVYQQIIADLEFGAANGPASSATGDKFKMTQAFAKGLLAKVYATAETKDWTKVRDYCNAVLAVGYSLLDDYEDLWSAGSQNTRESIFEITHSADAANWGYSMFLGANWQKFSSPSHDLEEAFTAAGDNIRRNSSITQEAVSWSTFWPPNQCRFMYKIRNNISSFILLRAADIMLLKAEALIELNQISAAADVIDEVRDRVNLPPLTAANKSSQSAMRLAVELERRLELAFEGHRWFDLLRTGRAIDVMTNCKNAAGVKSYNVEEWMLLYPVPQSERDNNENLTQNTGY